MTSSHMRIKNNHLTPLLVTGLLIVVSLLAFNTAYAEGSYTLYGAIKASVNATDDGNESANSISDNSTRFGLKGDKDIDENLNAFYQIELGVDVTERTEFNGGGRNSFIGLQCDFGKVMIGQHDTPYKDIRDFGAELFNDTIGGARSIISAVADDNGAKLDNRAKNAIMYKSPEFDGISLFLLYSTDMKTPSGTAKDGADDNDNDLYSLSATYKLGATYIAIAYEEKSNAGADDTESWRVAASYKFSEFQVGGIVESADNGNGNVLTRDAYSVNGRYNINAKTWAGVQLAMADDYDKSSNTSATNVSVGIMHKLAKPTTVYAVIAATANDNNASFGLAQGGIQDTVVAAAPGDDVTGLSVGVVHKF